MMEPRVLVLLSADYELFLGRNFLSAAEVLFAPTDELFAACRAAGVPLTLFADVGSVWAHRRFALDDYADRFEAQLRDAVGRGHDVQLHLHPHWLGARFATGEWRIATERMTLAECGFGAGSDEAPAIIRRGVDYLEDLLRSVDPGYRCLAFRGAGLALQPREGELIAALLAAGIAVDSSVVKGVAVTTDAIAMDYTRTPEAANWFMAPDSGISQAAPAGLFEVPIATFRLGLPRRLGFLLRRLRAVGQMRGSGLSRARRQTRWANLRTLVRDNLRYLGGDPWFVLSADTKGLTADLLSGGFDDYVHRHRSSETIVVSLICHPKLMFRRQLDLLRSFVDRVRGRYGEEVGFATFSAMAGEVLAANAARAATPLSEGVKR